MKVRIITADGKVVPVEGATQVVVFSDQDDPVSIAYTYGDQNTIITGHFAEEEWPKFLADCKISAPRKIHNIDF